MLQAMNKEPVGVLMWESTDLRFGESSAWGPSVNVIRLLHIVAMMPSKNISKCDWMWWLSALAAIGSASSINPA
jgi:hypothetical protein